MTEDSESESPAETVQHPYRGLWKKCAIGFLAFGTLYILLIIAGGQLREFAVAGLEAFPFAILAVLAYASRPEGTGGKILTLSYWVLLMGALGVVSIVLTIVVVLHLPLGANTVMALPQPTIEQILRIVAAGFALLIAGGIGLFCFSAWVRSRAATWIAVEPQSLVHATALATAVTMTLMCAIPLLAVNEPPILWLFKPESGSNLAESANSIQSTLYVLIWALPASFIAVGFPIKRTFSEAQQRLALVWPNRIQIVVAVVITLVLVLAVAPAQFLITAVWKGLGWRMTDTSAVEALFKFATQPLGAVIVGISAGVGEELVFRGVLQPRLGIVLPALLFTALHAFQYDFDALLWILLFGILMGVVRKKTNTTTVALIHATYDLLLLLSAYFFGW